uniref:RxLR effector candidate protein n=1 Tax=Hyaloperonospora arabidopsidis (strain Emoy2) TaxID=559515 RepID=M4C6P4_HYAAE
MDVEAFAVLLSRYDALSLPGTDWILRDDVIKTLLADRGAEEVARLLWSLRKVDGMEHDATVLHKCLGIYFDKKPRTILDAWRNLQLPPQELFEVLKLNSKEWFSVDITLLNMWFWYLAMLRRLNRLMTRAWSSMCTM